MAMAYSTGKRIVEMVYEDLKPSDILTRKSFENAIIVNSAIGGSTNAPPHLQNFARHAGVSLSVMIGRKLVLRSPFIKYATCRKFLVAFLEVAECQQRQSF